MRLLLLWPCKSGERSKHKQVTTPMLSKLYQQNFEQEPPSPPSYVSCEEFAAFQTLCAPTSAKARYSSATLKDDMALDTMQSAATEAADVTTRCSYRGCGTLDYTWDSTNALIDKVLTWTTENPLFLSSVFHVRVRVKNQSFRLVHVQGGESLLGVEAWCLGLSPTTPCRAKPRCLCQGSLPGSKAITPLAYVQVTWRRSAMLRLPLGNWN